jgi:hypothetical protein
VANPAVKIVISATDSASAVFRRVDTAINGVARAAFSLQGMLAGIGAGMIARDFIQTAAAAERLRHQLDTVTKGEGKSWFAAIDSWADAMPVAGDKAIETFVRMRTMGIQPTMEMFTAMADTAYSMPGDVNANFTAIGEALAKITEKGQASGKALNELTSKGIPAFDILREKFRLNDEQLQNLGKNGISAKQVVESIVEWMGKANAGQSAKFAESWDGQIKQLRETWEDFERAVMESGPFKIMKDQAKSLNDYLKTEEGNLELDKWAKQTAEGVILAFEGISFAAQGMVTGVNGFRATLAGIDIAIAKILQQADKLAAVKQMATGDLGQFLEGWKYLNLPGEKDPSKVGADKDFISAAKQMETEAQTSLDRAINAQIATEENFARARAKIQEIRKGVANSSNSFNAPEQTSFPPSTTPTAMTPEEMARLFGGSPDQFREVTDEILKTRRDLDNQLALLNKEGFEREEEEIRQYAAKLREQAQSDVVTLATIDKLYEAKMADVKKKRDAEYQAQVEESQRRQYEDAEKIRRSQPAAMATGFREEFRKMKTEMDDFQDYGARMARETAYAMESSFTDFFFDAFKGNLKSLSDYFTSFSNSILRAMSNIMAQQVAMGLMTSAGSAFSGMSFGGGAAAGAGAASAGGIQQAGNAPILNANGNVLRGGFQAFATGGIVNKPTLGLVGEGRYNEAIVPLPDGRRIPVEMKGGAAAPNVVVNVVNQTGQQANARQEQPQWNGREWVIGIVLTAMQRNEMGMRDAMRAI